MNIKPLHDRVVVRRIEEDSTSAGGIIIPDNAQEKPMQGEIVAVGPGKTRKDGNVQALSVNVGDKVLFGKYAGTEVKVDGETLMVMREDDLFAVIA